MSELRKLSPTPLREFTALRDHTGLVMVLDVHDGDTFTLALSSPEMRETRLAAHPPIRLLGIDCPELRENGGRAAREATLLYVTAARQARVRQHARSFERLVCEVVTEAGSLVDHLRAGGHVKHEWAPSDARWAQLKPERREPMK